MGMKAPWFYTEMSKIMRFLFSPNKLTFIRKYMFYRLSRLPCLHGLFTPVLPHGVFARVDEDKLTHCPRADVEDVLA